MGCGNSKQQAVLVRVKPRLSLTQEKVPLQRGPIVSLRQPTSKDDGFKGRPLEPLTPRAVVPFKDKDYLTPRDEFTSKEPLSHRDDWSIKEPLTPRALVTRNERDTVPDTGDGIDITHDPNFPVRPTRGKRENVVPSAEEFALIDDHALKAPEKVQSTLIYLAHYLVQPAKNDLEKVRSFFRWITQNIRYETTIFTKKGRMGPQDADSVLRRRCAVCAGYSNLFLSLCREAKIPCMKISGFSKAFGYDPETSFTADSKTDHAWNIVHIKGEWWPIDLTWAAGGVDKKTFKFKQQLTELYFLTEPKDFAIKHFPYINRNYAESCCFQLLENPLSIEEFNRAIAPHNSGIEWGFESRTHRQVVDFDKVCELQIATSKVKMVDVSCSFKDVKKGKDFREYVLLRKHTGGAFSVKITPPETGKFELTLYGKCEHDDTESKSLMTYVIRCQSVMANVDPYPEHSGTWGVKAPLALYGFYLDAGNIDVMTSRAGRAEIKLKVSPDIQLSFQLHHSQDKRDDLDQFFMASITQGILKVKFRFPIVGYFRFRIFARNLNSTSKTLDHVGDILIKSKDVHSDLQPYPEGQGIYGLRGDTRWYGIISSDHGGDEISSENGEILMKFKVKRQIRPSFKLEHSRQNKYDLNKFLFAFIQDEYLNIKLRLPVIGYYKLKMYAQNLAESRDTNNDFIGQFLLCCTDACENLRPYPDHWGLWGAKPMATDYGFTSAIFNNNLLTATQGEIAMNLPVAPSTSVSFALCHSEDGLPDIKRYCFSYIQSDILNVRIRLPRAGFYKLTLHGRHPDKDASGSYDHIGDFLLENKEDGRNLQPYPFTFSKANEYGFVLLEPLFGDLPANQNVRLSVTSEMAMRIMVNKKVHTKRNNNEFDVNFTTPGPGEDITVYGSMEETGSLDGIYKFACKYM